MSHSTTFLLIITLSFLSSPTNARNNLTSTLERFELETLLKIMDTLSSDENWRVSHPNPCQPGSSWLGIECKITGIDNKYHVTRLDLGTPPNPSCKKTATFPPEIFQLPHLESIFIFKCFTSMRTRISFSPNTPVSSSPIQQLSLRSNSALIGTIPPQISTLKLLQILTLSQNKLAGRIPVQLFGLTALVHLDLSYNLFSGSIPSQVGDLKSLAGLDFSYNSLTGTIPSRIGELFDLQKLDISSNSLTGTFPETFHQLRSLNFLALSNNRFSGPFPKGLAGLSNLQYFLMDENPMSVPLPEFFGQLKKLQELRLSNSGYSGTVPSTLSQLTNLSTLSLQNNRLSGQIPNGVGKLSHIYHLNLSRNLLDGVVPFDSNFLRRLGRNLDLSGNPGLCLSPNEAHQVEDIGVCVNNRSTSSLVKPLKKSNASLECDRSLVFLSSAALIFLTLLQILSCG